jgi:hypothetical protein
MFVHGKNTEFSIDDSAGTLRDISDVVNGVNFSPTADTAEVSAFQANSKGYVPGLKDCTFSIEFSWDATVDGYLFGILGKIGSFDYSPDGTIHYTGEAICTAYTPASAVNDAVKGSASFQVNGDVSRA